MEELKSAVFEAMVEAVKNHSLKISQPLADLLSVLKAEEMSALMAQYYYKATFTNTEVD